MIQNLGGGPDAMDRYDLVAVLGAGPKYSGEHALLDVKAFVEAWPGIESDLADIPRFRKQLLKQGKFVGAFGRKLGVEAQAGANHL
jgi:hypothetical protein